MQSLRDQWQYRPGSNYILTADGVVLNGQQLTLEFPVTGVSGRVRIANITFAHDQENLGPRDLLVEELIIDRINSTNPERINLLGQSPLQLLCGEGGGLPGILPAEEFIAGHSSVQMTIRNNAAQGDIGVIVTLSGYTLAPLTAAERSEMVRAALNGMGPGERQTVAEQLLSELRPYSAEVPGQSDSRLNPGGPYRTY